MKPKNKTDLRPESDPGFAAAIAVAVAGVCSVILCFAAIILNVTSPAVCVLVAALLFSVATGVILVYTGRSIKKKETAGGNVSDSILRDSIMTMPFPMLICESGGEKIIWYNKAAGAMGTPRSLFGTVFSSVFGLSLEEAVPEEGEGGTAELGGRLFKFSGRHVSSADKDFVILTLEDITELRQAYADAAARECTVMYIVADNLEELAEKEKEQYRAVSGDVSRILTEWAAGFGGILKEYDRDCYLCILEASALEENIAKKFELLDRIREIRFGESITSATLSVGAASVGDSFSEREKAARQALEMALQRGGDQVVVKTDSAVEFYGGHTKTVRKRTTVRARVLANELLTHISKFSSVMIMGHRFADFDCFGAAVGVARLAMFCGTPVHIVTDPEDGGMDACREIMSRQRDYDGIFVSRDEAIDMVQSDMLLVIVDVNNMALLESPELAERCDNIIVIDHHRKTAEFEREPVLTYIETAAAAASELVAEMLEQCLPAGLLTASEANMMMAGIALDTKQFTRNTGVRTFSAALYLRDCGADTTAVQELFKTSLEDFTREARFRSNVVVYRGRFAVALGDGEGENADRVAAAKAADKLLSVEGVEASFALIKIGSTVHISARSGGSVNVQLILESLRGGGHFDSAGAQVEAGSLTDALTMLKGAIDGYVNGGK